MMSIINKIFKKENKIKIETVNEFFTQRIFNFIDREKNNVVFDIGAYNGSTIEKILNLVKNTKIHAFEPNSSNFEILKRKYSNSNYIILNQTAISNFNGRSLLNININAETNSLKQSQETIDTHINSLIKNICWEEVNVTTIDQYCFEKNIGFIDFLKIDAQGVTYEILEGASKTLSARQINSIYLEVEFQKIYEDEKLFSEIEMLLRSYGYKIFDFYNLNYFQDKSLAWCDVLFIKS